MNGLKVWVMMSWVLCRSLIIVMIDISEVFLISLMRVLFRFGRVICVVCGRMMSCMVCVLLSFRLVVVLCWLGGMLRMVV